jgi:hypothetical protein
MEEKDIIQQEDSKVQEFITKVEVGNANTQNSKNNEESIRRFVLNKRLEYADAATRASKIPANSYEHAELSSKMNDIVGSIRNLATQKNALVAAQNSFFSDYESGLISNANSLDDGGNKFADAYTGRLPIDIDNGGNILFDRNGKKEPVQGFINYTLKDYSTAQDILDITNKVYNSGKPMNDVTRNFLEASIKEKLAKGGRNTLMSLWSDGLIPGLSYKNIDKNYFKPENTEALFNLTVKTLGDGLSQVANQGYSMKEAEKQRRAQPRGQVSASSGAGSQTTLKGVTGADMALAKQIKEKTNRIKGSSKDIDALVIRDKFFVWGQDAKTKKQGWIQSASPVKYEPPYEGEGAGKIYSDAELLNITSAPVKKAYDSLK